MKNLALVTAARTTVRLIDDMFFNIIIVVIVRCCGIVDNPYKNLLKSFYLKFFSSWKGCGQPLFLLWIKMWMKCGQIYGCGQAEREMKNKYAKGVNKYIKTKVVPKSCAHCG